MWFRNHQANTVLTILKIRWKKNAQSNRLLHVMMLNPDLDTWWWFARYVKRWKCARNTQESCHSYFLERHSTHHAGLMVVVTPPRWWLTVSSIPSPCSLWGGGDGVEQEFGLEWAKQQTESVERRGKRNQHIRKIHRRWKTETTGGWMDGWIGSDRTFETLLLLFSQTCCCFRSYKTITANDY